MHKNVERESVDNITAHAYYCISFVSVDMYASHALSKRGFQASTNIMLKCRYFLRKYPDLTLQMKSII